MKYHHISVQFIKFAFVGVINTLTTFLLYTALTRSSGFFKSEYVLAEAIAYGCGTVVSFLLNRRWTFRQKVRTNVFELFRFYTVMASGLLLNVSALYALVHILGIYDLVAVAFSLVITIVWNFILMKFWVFTAGAPDAENRARRVIVVFSGRFPSEKADALFAHENALAFRTVGQKAVLIAPKRLGHGSERRQPYEVVYLPTIDLIRIPLLWSLASYVNLLVFSCFLYFWLSANARESDIVLCNEPIPLLFASLAVRNILYEIHILPVRHAWFYRMLFRRVTLALPINRWNAQLAELHGLSPGRIVIARSAVDASKFAPMEKRAARRKLGLEDEAAIALYSGHLFGWKGVDTLAEAARLAPEVTVIFVGGTDTDIASFRKKYADVANIRVVGRVPHEDVPLWQAAADVLVIPNSGKTKISMHYTSPMKLFEYMASERPILASDLPSIREILTEETGYFATADDPRSFAAMLQKILADKFGAESRARAARVYAQKHTWEKRAKRILDALGATAAKNLAAVASHYH